MIKEYGLLMELNHIHMDIRDENKSEHTLKWPYVPDHPYRILII